MDRIKNELNYPVYPVHPCKMSGVDFLLRALRVSVVNLLLVVAEGCADRCSRVRGRISEGYERLIVQGYLVKKWIIDSKED